jgi:hypothetical protein
MYKNDNVTKDIENVMDIINYFIQRNKYLIYKDSMINIIKGNYDMFELRNTEIKFEDKNNITDIIKKTIDTNNKQYIKQRMNSYEQYYTNRDNIIDLHVKKVNIPTNIDQPKKTPYKNPYQNLYKNPYKKSTN